MEALRDTTRLRSTTGYLASKLGAGDVVLLNLQSGTYFGLDAVGVFVWEHLQAHPLVSLAELVAAVTDRYAVEPADCRQDLHAFLTDLHQEGIVEFVPAPVAG
jgi:hypothetical protein